VSRASGGAVWSNRPRTDLARAPAEKLAGATQQFRFAEKINITGQRESHSYQMCWRYNNGDRANLSPAPFKRSSVSQADPVGYANIDFVRSRDGCSAACPLGCSDIGPAATLERLVDRHGDLGVPSFDLVIVSICCINRMFPEHCIRLALKSDHPDKIAKFGAGRIGRGYKHYTDADNKK
jgi:hypothetical protein